MAMSSLSSLERDRRATRRWKRAAAIAAALIVMAVGGFIALVLVWFASFNSGSWAATPAERRQRLTWAAVVFGSTVLVVGLILWRGLRNADRSR
jgi:hypothetical protein